MHEGSEGRRRPTVVLVEDQEEIRELITFVVESEGYRMVSLPDGERASEVIAQERPGLVLLDLILPVKGGNEILQELALDPHTRSIPVVVLSAYIGSLQATPQVRRAMLKPFEVDELISVMRETLAEARTEGDGPRS